MTYYYSPLQHLHVVRPKVQVDIWSSVRFHPLSKGLRAMCVKCAPATSATSLMTRIQNGGRGDGEWKSELLLSLRHTLPSHSAQSVSGELPRS